ncbi:MULTISPECIES: hypothetical protein [unclassified Streptomyces]|uniref:hypothetical protein n=1 Tax=unclassified Streptomyces TaxID=2593676 RepID=UPI000DB95A1B|nr:MULTISPECIES: hypothetical protein [unclassified Streptomyces]MYT68280.1 hypothetical protein [Streptomyces sp. SID8367]RAJ76914.1 hypothetical protein K377_06082 [Streptomyces sp. PsTaAH-137]
MTSPIDEVLSRARLRDDDFAYHYLPSPLPAGNDTPAPNPPRPSSGDGAFQRRTRRAAADRARSDLTTLCHTAISLAGTDHLTEFLDDTLLPEPESARTLGCYLHLGGAHDGARFWWQFAAGAGDHTAAYCLHLHHLSLEETDPAAWWQTQTAPTSPSPNQAPPDGEDTSVPTTLRVLRQLKLHQSLRTPPPPPLQQDIIDSITRAVSFVDDDLELPLPDRTFTAKIRALHHNAATPPQPEAPHPQHTTRAQLPRRQPGTSQLALRTAAKRAARPTPHNTEAPHQPATGAGYCPDLLHA